MFPVGERGASVLGLWLSELEGGELVDGLGRFRGERVTLGAEEVAGV